MAVKKPIDKFISEKDIDTLISKGAPVSEDNKKESDHKKSTHINLRIPKNLLKQVDELMKQRIGISRIGWILEAIQEKIKRVENEQ